MKTLPPNEVLRADGLLVLTDGSSYFLFVRDGTFRSFPCGLSGRTFQGTWTAPFGSPCIFTVEATASWVNGVSAANDYRNIIFVVYMGNKRPLDKAALTAVPAPPKEVREVWDGYFIIDELTKIKSLTRYSGFTR